MKENQRVTITKRMLREGLLHLLEEKPIDKISVTLLCQESGINRATFYAHYTSVQDVLREMGQQIMADLAALQSRHAGEGFYPNAQRMCQYLADNADAVRILLRNYSGQELSQFFIATYEQTIRETASQSPDMDNLRLVTAYLAGGCYSLIKLWLEDDLDKTPAQIAQLLTYLFSENLLEIRIR